MKFLLLTDMPPCHNFTAGLVLERLVSFLPQNQIAICAVVDRSIKPIAPKYFCDIPQLILTKPRESALRLIPGILGDLTAFLFELIQGVRTAYQLSPKIMAFAREQKVDALWAVLQGQTMIRLASHISDALALPLFTQVWDPFEWWLRANRIDHFTQRRLRKMFDKVLLRSTSCATASSAMSEAYTHKYRVKNLPVIAGLPSAFAHPPALQPHPGNEYIICIAGQFYARSEWDCLIRVLNEANWSIGNRRIRIRVLGAGFQSFTQTPVNFEYLGWRPQEETIRLLEESDLLYLPYWFSEEFREEACNSFPSKLVSYFAAGRPVFCHAPSYASPAKYIAENDAGFLCNSLEPNQVFNSLKYAITATEHYGRVAKNGSICFWRDFTLERMQEAFYNFLGYQAVSHY